MKVTTVGIDLAKNVFQLHGVNEGGHPSLKKQLKRSQMTEFFANLPPCLIGMEAYASAHYWARKLQPKYRSYPTPARAGGGVGRTVCRVIRSQM
jgi:transposase